MIAIIHAYVHLVDIAEKSLLKTHEFVLKKTWYIIHRFALFQIMTQITFSINIFYTDFIFIAKVVIHLVDGTRDLYFMAGCNYYVTKKTR